MIIGGIEMSRADVERRVGNLSQLGSLRRYRLEEGSSRGVAAVDFANCSGFDFTILPDRALDISRASYKGASLVYHTISGEAHPSYYDPAGSEWLRNFFGGLLTTCGLTYFGHPGRDGDEELGLHGRVSNIPARRVCDLSRWEGDDYVLALSGVVQEASFFGDKLSMERTISSRLGSRKLEIRDVVRNVGYRDSPFTILYHMNVGFPLLDDGAEFALSAARVEGGAGVEAARRFSAPVPGFQEQLFLYEMRGGADGRALICFANRQRGLGLYASFNVDALPYLNEWKMIGEGEYIVGLEPLNTKMMDRGQLRERGLLPTLKPGESRTIALEIGVLDGAGEIDGCMERITRIAPGA